MALYLTASRLPHRICITLLAFVRPALAQAPPKPDPPGRGNPRSWVTGFLLACRNQDYQRAAEYLDLQHLSASNRAERGPILSRDLEAILNSSPHFNVLRLSRSPEGDLSDDPDPMREHVVGVKQNSITVTLDLERLSLQTGAPPIWIFSSDTVAAIPQLTPSAAPPAIAHYLPPFLVYQTLLETPLWKWLALTLAIIVLIFLGRLLGHLLRCALRFVGKRFTGNGRIPVIEIAIGPARVVLSLAVLRAL